MKQIIKKADKQYGFCVGSLSCVFRVEDGEREMTLLGEEREDGTVIFRSTLSFPCSDRQRVEEFARALAESQTFPRMMIELAEEYFSSAVFE